MHTGLRKLLGIKDSYHEDIFLTLFCEHLFKEVEYFRNHLI